MMEAAARHDPHERVITQTWGKGSRPRPARARPRGFPGQTGSCPRPWHLGFNLNATFIDAARCPQSGAPTPTEPCSRGYLALPPTNPARTNASASCILHLLRLMTCAFRSGPEYHRPPCYVARWAGPAYARVHAAHVPSHVRASPTMCAGGESSARLSLRRFALVAAVVPARVLSAVRARVSPLLPACVL